MHTTTALKAGDLAGSTRIQLSENLTSVPPALYDLADTLEILDLSCNQLSELPSDFGRFTQLKILFLSNNDFEVLPEVLADCQALTMIGFKANKIHSVPENSLPVNTRWLILTDNNIAALPQSMGALHQLQKLMLAGNALTSLPETMCQCEALELVRLSANQFTTLPDFLFDLPRLAWLAYSGNPFCRKFESERLPVVGFDDLDSGEVLGQGASGVISRATWIDPAHTLAAGYPTVAVKKFKGEVTSDGFPDDELRACIAAGTHANLVELVAQINSPEGSGLVMGLIEESFKNLGQPPTFQSCTRDHFPEGFTLTLTEVHTIAQQVAETMQHLYLQGICHGDLYAHNILITEQADVLFGDFGAASNYESLSEQQAHAMQRIEVRAFGCLLDDLLSICPDADTERDGYMQLIQLKDRCMDSKIALRPAFSQIIMDLAARD